MKIGGFDILSAFVACTGFNRTHMVKEHETSEESDLFTCDEAERSIRGIWVLSFAL